MEKLFYIEMSDDTSVTGQVLYPIELVDKYPDEIFLKSANKILHINYVAQFRLNKQAKLTDFIYTPQRIKKNQSIINDNLKTVFECHNLPSHYYSKIEITDYENKIVERYNLLIFFAEEDYQYIDFSKSVFHLYERMTIIDSISFLNAQDLFAFWRANCDWKLSLKADHIQLKPVILPDIFTLPFDQRIYVRESLAKAIKSEAITGIALRNKPKHLFL